MFKDSDRHRKNTIVLVSGYGDLLNPEELRAAGIHARVTKPPESGELARAVRSALDAAAPVAQSQTNPHDS